MIKLFFWFLVCFIARAAMLLFSPLLLFYSAMRYSSFKESTAHYKDLAIAIDQLGNVVAKYLFNDLLIKPESNAKFGNPDETISSVIGKNKLVTYLTKWGIAFDKFLNLFEKNHSIKAIEKDEK
jgi:hypothetical protein